jgi:hypothetical protein
MTAWYSVNGSKTQVAGWSTYTFLLWIIKAAMCTFYLRLTDGLYNFRTRIYVGFVLIVVSWLAVLFSILFGCFPMEKNWQIYPDPGSKLYLTPKTVDLVLTSLDFCQPAISKIDIFVTVVLNVVTDIYLLTIPLPMLWQSKLPPFKKAGLMVLFSGGAFVTMAGILRCVLILTVRWERHLCTGIVTWANKQCLRIPSMEPSKQVRGHVARRLWQWSRPIYP